MMPARIWVTPEAHARFEADIAKGVCIICGATAEAGTRYCGGDGGCPKGQ